MEGEPLPQGSSAAGLAGAEPAGPGATAPLPADGSPQCVAYHHPTTIQSTVHALRPQTISSFRSFMRWEVRTAPMGVAKA